MTSFCKYSVDLGITEGKVWELEEPFISRNHMVFSDTQARHVKTDKTHNVNWPEVIRQIPVAQQGKFSAAASSSSALEVTLGIASPHRDWVQGVPSEFLVLTRASGVFRKLNVKFLQVIFVDTPDVWAHWRNKPPAWDPSEYFCWTEVTKISVWHLMWKGQSFRLIKSKGGYISLSQNKKKWLQELARKVLHKEYLKNVRGARLAIWVRNESQQ